ncbi:putative pentatricopeptide repeat-containing protein At5g08310, mitochondrial [Amborella trichopoda]|uniref:putative pentatricopeptide repeat-containing protein At5g08310, mitochondrial n=1 Tax=Amborella trichopoda TaxID=13333 RepID=UPI0005D36D37|nr:putative pentatricopeptide repeat-containing protein At5g08310, mitochondrial [Amborella trichopoda]|eukprot:XP_011627972.1 putative pentatricopeptide repeat-containing protein At5g08310, mitochondrial [Amborella trichopoda]
MDLNEKTYCILIHGFTKENRIDKALVLFDWMKGLGFDRDVPLFMEGDLVAASWLLQDGNKLSIGPFVSLYNAVLEGLVNGGKVNEAYLLLQEMIASNNLSDEEIAGCASDNEEVEYITNLFKFEKAVIPNSDSYSIVIDGLCKYQELDKALELLHDMAANGCIGNLLLYNNLIHEMCNADRLQESFKLMKAMRGLGLEPNHFTYNSIFGCLCRKEKVSDVLDLMREMLHHGHTPWIKHDTILLKRLCTRGNAMEACQFLSDLEEVGFLPNVIAYSAAIDGLCRIEELDHALKLFHDVHAHGYAPDVVAHNVLIHGFCKEELMRPKA